MRIFTGSRLARRLFDPRRGGEIDDDARAARREKSESVGGDEGGGSLTASPTASCRRGTPGNAAGRQADLRIDLEIDFRQIDDHPLGSARTKALARTAAERSKTSRALSPISSAVDGGGNGSGLRLFRGRRRSVTPGLIGGRGLGRRPRPPDATAELAEEGPPGDAKAETSMMKAHGEESSDRESDADPIRTSGRDIRRAAPFHPFHAAHARPIPARPTHGPN